ncbi:Membrin-11 [Glycine max]|nr:Membrin-11 [Glycine max]
MEAKERAELLGRAVCHCWLSHFGLVIHCFIGFANLHELENANALGEAILSTIHGQRDRLKSAHRKALDVLNTVGISNSVLRLIERRNRGDQWIKYAGKLLTIIFLIAFVLWRH